VKLVSPFRLRSRMGSRTRLEATTNGHLFEAIPAVFPEESGIEGLVAAHSSELSERAAISEIGSDPEGGTTSQPTQSESHR
jgi:hypothetical protein